jgi:DNA-binding CsgD family transcriptional regulator
MQTPIFNHDEHWNLSRFGQGVKLNPADHAKHSRGQLSLTKLYEMPFNVYFMNTESAVQTSNEMVLKTFNILSMEDAIGITVREVAKKESAEFSLLHDSEIMNTQRMIIKDELYTRLDEVTFPMLTIKSPWYDENNRLTGIFGMSLMIDKEWGVSLADSIHLLTQTGLLQPETQVQKIFPGLVLDDQYFTQREKEILFHLLRGKTAKAIADFLGRSRRTIEHHIENMKVKTRSHSKSEMIEKIIDQLMGRDC